MNEKGVNEGKYYLNLIEDLKEEIQKIAN